MDWAKTAARGYKKHLSFGIWCDLYYRFYGNVILTHSQQYDTAVGICIVCLLRPVGMKRDEYCQVHSKLWTLYVVYINGIWFCYCQNVESTYIDTPCQGFHKAKAASKFEMHQSEIYTRNFPIDIYWHPYKINDISIQCYLSYRLSSAGVSVNHLYKLDYLTHRGPDK